MADKARAEVGRESSGEYIYNCPIDQAITDFAGFTAEDIQGSRLPESERPGTRGLGPGTHPRTLRRDIAVQSSNSRKRPGRTSRNARSSKRRLQTPRRNRTDITTWFDLLDVDDEVSFGVVDLTRHPPKSPYDDSVGGLFGLARMIDKGRAAIHDLLGQYKYAEDSGLDKKIAEFFGFSMGDFTDLIRAGRTDEEILTWLKDNHGKSSSEISDFNRDIGTIEPWNEKRRTWFRGVLAGLDESRTDVTTYMALIVLDDTIHFARRKTAI